MPPDCVSYCAKCPQAALQATVPRIEVNGASLTGHLPLLPLSATSSPLSFLNAEYSDSNDDLVFIDAAVLSLDTNDTAHGPGWATTQTHGSYVALPSLSGVGTVHSLPDDVSTQVCYPAMTSNDLEQSRLPQHLGVLPANHPGNIAFRFPQNDIETPSNESDGFSLISHVCHDCKSKDDQIGVLNAELCNLKEQLLQWQQVVKDQHTMIKTQQSCISTLEEKDKQDTNEKRRKRGHISTESRMVEAIETQTQRCVNSTSPTKRGKFAPQQRKQTAETRQKGACIKCWKHKQRCDPGVDKDGPCKNCKEPSLSLTRIPCIRTHIIDLIIFRCGTGSNDTWTRRDEVERPKDLTTYTSPDRKRLVLTQGFGPQLQVNVRLYRPVRDDVTDYIWRDGQGMRRCLPMPHFALSDVNDLCQSLPLWLRDNMDAYIKNYISPDDVPIWKAFQVAKKLAKFEKVMDDESQPELYADFCQSDLLRDTLQLWTAARLIEKPWQICGEERLGLTTGNHWWWVPITPIMDTQLDQIVIKSCLLPLKKSVLQKLQLKIEKEFRQSWFEILITIMILLNTIEEATRHDHEFAMFFGHEYSSGCRRFEDYKLIESYFHSAVALLTHVKVSFDGRLPYLDGKVDISKLMSSCHDEDEKDYMIETDKYINDRNRTIEFETIRDRHQYEAHQYFVHQIFLKDWDGRPIVIREKE